MLVEEPKALDESMAYAGSWGDSLSIEVMSKLRAEMKKRGHDMYHVGFRRRSVRHRRRLGRRARRAHRRAARRARDAGGGISPRRHLRHSRLRAEEASGLCRALPRRI